MSRGLRRKEMMGKRASRGAATVTDSPLSIAAIFAFAVVGMVFGGARHALPAILGPLLFCLCMLADTATSVALLYKYRTMQQKRALIVLALSFAANGLLTLLTMFSVPLLPQIPAVIRVAPAGIWFYLVYHVFAAAGALAYVAYRGGKRGSTAFLFWASLSAAAGFAGVIGTMFAFAHQLPRLADGTSLTGFRSSGIGIALVVAFGANALLASRTDKPTLVDRAVMLAQVVLALDVLVTLLHGDRYSISFYLTRSLQLAASMVVLIAAMRSLAEAKTKADGDLERSQRESEQRAARIVAFQRIGAVQETTELPQDRFVRMLDIAAAAIRPGKRFIATLSHLDRGSIVFDAVAGLEPKANDPEPAIIRAGTVLPLANSIQSLLYADGVTKAWDDIEQSAISGTTIATYLGTHAMIGSPVQIGRQTHFIVFSTTDAMPQSAPFEPNDIAYIDVVASLFASAFTQIEQIGRLRFQMEHDALTGLKNRVEFRKAIREQIAGGSPFAVAIVNLNDFRQVNALFGQMIADEVLVEVGVALDRTEPGDLVARLSGDEFGILIRRSGGLPIEAVLAPYLAPFDEPFHTGDRDGTRMLSLQASLGAARFPDDGNTPEELVHAAGAALHVAKDRGARESVVYERSMEEHIERRRAASSDIAGAIEKDQLRLVYQPTFDLSSRAIVGAEALVRWDHPERGEISPVDFIPAAEKYGLIGGISRWVFQRLVRDLETHALPAGFRCYFNLSTQDIEDGAFVAILTAAFIDKPHLSDMIGVEITESGIMKNVERSRATLDLIRGLGVRVAIDDFGTGHSSLAYLKQLKVDMIKIDRSFVAGLPANETDAALSDTMIDIASRLHLITLAEGIETDEQCAWLRAHGCAYGQGYLIARPLAIDALLALTLRRPGMPSVN
jgi:diguanylate cyclase (GGDEF)-like protein